MERGIKILHNRIRCKICGQILESKSTHQFVPCKCFCESGGEKGCFVDGGHSYFRWGGDPGTYENLSETRPYTDEEVDAYNAHQELLAEQYGFSINYMEKMEKDYE